MQTSSIPHPVSIDAAPYAYQTRAFGPLWTEHKRRIAACCRPETDAGDRIASKLIGCCRHPHIVTIGDGLRYHLTEQRCKSRVCPRCARFRAKALAVRIADLVRRMDDPRFLTLTVRSTDQPLHDQVKRLRRRFATMRRRPDWKAHVLGGVYTIEITRNDRTGQWHPHLHAIIDGSFYAQAELLRQWETIVGDHAGVDIRAVRGVRRLANYLACYVAKSCDLDHLTHAQLAEWAVETHGLRLAQTFGCLQNCKPQTPSADELDPLPIRYVDIDVHRLAYDASHNHAAARQLLEMLEPVRHRRPVQQPGTVLGLINTINREIYAADHPPNPPPRDRQGYQFHLNGR